MKKLLSHMVILILFIIHLASYSQINQHDSLGLKTGRWVFNYSLTDSVNVYYVKGSNKEIVSYFSRFMKYNFGGKYKIRNAKLIEHYKNDKRNGVFYFYLNDSILHTRGHYKKGLLNGIIQSYRYDSNNVVWCENNYSYNKGLLNGPEVHFLIPETTVSIIKNGQLDGESISYLPNGKVKYYTEYSNGVCKTKAKYYIGDSITFFIIRENETRVYENGFWVHSIVGQEDNRRLASISHFDRISDKNRFHLFFNKRKLKKRYEFNFRIKVTRRKHEKR